MRFIFIVFGILLMGTFLSNCSDDVTPDLTAPVIDVISPAEEDSYEAGSYLPYRALYIDDQELASTNIEFHNAFDDHGHGRKKEDPDLIKYSFKESYDLSSDAYTLDLPEEILIPENAMAGPYHFIVQALDVSGNATNFQDGSNIELLIFIINNSMAMITVTNLEGDDLVLTPGQPLLLEGTIADPDHASLGGIEEVMITLAESEDIIDHDHGRMAEELLYEIEIPETELNDFQNPDGTLDLSGMMDYTLNEDTALELKAKGVDHLRLTIQVLDKQGNISIKIIPVFINIS